MIEAINSFLVSLFGVCQFQITILQFSFSLKLDYVLAYTLFGILVFFFVRLLVLGVFVFVPKSRKGV